MAKKISTRISSTLYRDAKGRIQSFNKISPENNHRRYEGKEIKLKFAQAVQTATKEKIIDKETGKPRIKITTKTEYFGEFGKKVSKRDFLRYQNGIKIQAKQTSGAPRVIEEKTFLGFTILNEINNRLIENLPTYYKGKLITPDNYLEIAEKLRKKITGKPAKTEEEKKNKKYKLFGMQFFSDTTAEIFEASTEEEEEEENEQ
jgi:hypothetical protein